MIPVYFLQTPLNPCSLIPHNYRQTEYGQLQEIPSPLFFALFYDGLCQAVKKEKKEKYGKGPRLPHTTLEFLFAHAHSSSLVLLAITSYHPERASGKVKENRWPWGKIIVSSLFPQYSSRGEENRQEEGRILLTIPKEFPDGIRVLLPDYVHQTSAWGASFHFVHLFFLCLHVLQNLAQNHNPQCLHWSLLKEATYHTWYFGQVYWHTQLSRSYLLLIPLISPIRLGWAWEARTGP